MAEQNPVETITHGDVTASIWRNTNDEGKAFYSLTLSRRYQKDGQTQFTSNIDEWDLAPAIQCLKDAGVVMDKLRAADRELDQSAA